MDGYAVRAADAGEELPIAGRVVRRRRSRAARAAHGHDDRDGRAAAGGRRRRRAGRARARRTATASRSTAPVAARRPRARRAAPTSPRAPSSSPRAAACARSRWRRSRPAGVAELSCHRAPRVCVVVTGDELVAPGEPLLPRPDPRVEQHPRSPRAASRPARRSSSVERVRDDAEATREALARALEEADVVVTSGGVSVGHPRSRQARAGRARRRAAVLAPRRPARPADLVRAARRARRRRPAGQPALGAWSGSSCCCCRRCGASRAPPTPGPPTFRLPLTDGAAAGSRSGCACGPCASWPDGAEPLGADLSHQLGRAAIADALALVPIGRRRARGRHARRADRPALKPDGL